MSYLFNNLRRTGRTTRMFLEARSFALAHPVIKTLIVAHTDTGMRALQAHFTEFSTAMGLVLPSNLSFTSYPALVRELDAEQPPRPVQFDVPNWFFDHSVFETHHLDLLKAFHKFDLPTVTNS